MIRAAGDLVELINEIASLIVEVFRRVNLSVDNRGNNEPTRNFWIAFDACESFEVLTFLKINIIKLFAQILLRNKGIVLQTWQSRMIRLELESFVGEAMWRFVITC
jgi:hypothetical protein